MIQAQKVRIVVRPQQPLYWLAVLGFFLIGIINAGQIYGRGAYFFGLAYIALSFGFLCDKIAFDGTTVKRTGLGSALLSLLGKENSLSLDEIEVISSYASQSINSKIQFQTVISGADIKWRIKSNQKNYPTFIKALFKAANPHLLDPLSTELLLYWQEMEPIFKLVNDTKINAHRIERWRKKAITLSFNGEFQPAASYFKLAHENSPHDPQIAYDIGRFLRRRAMMMGVKSDQGGSDLMRAETYFRMAGRLAWEKKNSRILERVGEAFFEFHQLDTARKYFEMATRLDPVRLRANLGLAGIALQDGQAARAVYAYNQIVRGAENAGAKGLGSYALRKAEYFERLLRDDDFLSKESSWNAVLTQLKWARRFAFTLFLFSWIVQITSFAVTAPIRAMSQEISATSLIIWVCTLTASQIILALRRS